MFCDHRFEGVQPQYYRWNAERTYWAAASSAAQEMAGVAAAEFAKNLENPTFVQVENPFPLLASILFPQPQTSGQAPTAKI